MMAGWLARTGYRPSRAGIVSNVELLRCAVRGSRSGSSGSWSYRASAPPSSARAAAARLAKVLAARRPDLVSGVVTLGSPQVGPLAVHPLVRLQVEAVGRLGIARRPGPVQALLPATATAARVLGGPRAAAARRRRLVSVYSKSDGVVDWRSCLDPRATELVEIRASHCGMAVIARGLARGRGRARRLPRLRGAPPAGAARPAAPAPARGLAGPCARASRHHDRRAADLTGAQVVERLVRLLEPEGGDLVRTGTRGASSRNSSRPRA